MEEFTPEGKYLQQFSSTGMQAGEFTVKRLAFDHEAHLWVSELGSGQVEEFNESGEALREPIKKITGLNINTGVEIEGQSNVWVAEEGNSSLDEYY